MDNTQLFTFGHFTGMNNVDKSFRVPSIRNNAGVVYSDMDALENMDIDNSFVLSTRTGSDLKLSGTDVHSLWSDDETCLFVDYDKLYMLNPSYTKTELLTGLEAGARMSYVPVNDRVYFANGSYIGYFHNLLAVALSDPNVTYKLPLPAGQRIAYYRGRLYVAKGKVLYISDALCDHYDIRTGFRIFENDITMVRPVDRGIYVADGETHFMLGLEPDEFQRIKVSDSDVIPFTDKNVNGILVGDGTEGNLAMWTSTEGICLGDNSGVVKNLTRSRWHMDSHGIGGAAIRNIDGQVHYITTLE